MRSIEQRFRSYFTPSPGCWVWQGATDNHGYGVLNTVIEKPRIAKAHRLSWRFHKGEIPKGMVVMHAFCDNPICVNPAHLMLGTQQENLSDMRHKMRHVYGNKFPQSKLTEDIIREIRRRYIPLGKGRKKGSRGCNPNSINSLAKEFGVNYKTMYEVVTNRTWQHVH